MRPDYNIGLTLAVPGSGCPPCRRKGLAEVWGPPYIFHGISLPPARAIPLPAAGTSRLTALLAALLWSVEADDGCDAFAGGEHHAFGEGEAYFLGACQGHEALLGFQGPVTVAGGEAPAGGEALGFDLGGEHFFQGVGGFFHRFGGGGVQQDGVGIAALVEMLGDGCHYSCADGGGDGQHFFTAGEMLEDGSRELQGGGGEDLALPAVVAVCLIGALGGYEQQGFLSGFFYHLFVKVGFGKACIAAHFREV